jgi:hypothetical protein
MAGLLQVQNLYGHVLDHFLWDKLGEVFAPDGVFDPRDAGLPLLSGVTEIREKLGAQLEGPDRVRRLNHMAMNPAVIEVREDGVVRMMAKYIVTGDSPFISFGEYEDEMVKTPDGWRIKHRKTRRLSRHHLQHVEAKS